MPIYEYRCDNCAHEFETIQKFSDAPLKTCPVCSEEALRKKISAAGFRLKGGGWYETDFKSDRRKNVAGEDKGSKDGAGKSSAGADGGSGGGADKSGGGGSEKSGGTSDKSAGGAGGKSEKSSSKSEGGSSSGASKSKASE